jgi:hypothetical protein
VKPVYPLLSGPPHPLAQALCDTLHGLVARRRAECCGGAPTSTVISECLRNVTGAIALGSVELSQEGVESCKAASERELAGCDWVTPLTGASPLPKECDGLLRGKLAKGAKCRSSLECAAPLHCAGLGPTAAGVCAPPLDEGICGGSIDVLSSYARQLGAERDHPECTGLCVMHHCRPLVKVGEACSTGPQCGENAVCQGGRCVPGAPGKVAGEPCPDGRCAGDLSCVEGACVARKREGETCRSAAECRGSCEKGDAGAGGTCIKRCIPYLSAPFSSAFPRKTGRP